MDIWVQDWAYAKLRVQETNRPAPYARRMQDLVPGDRYVHLGDEFEVMWWMTGGTESEDYVSTVRVKDRHGTTGWVKTHPDLTVAAWKGRDVNYGTGRCGHCMCYVQRDHVLGSQDCMDAGRERRESQSDWEVAAW